MLSNRLKRLSLIVLIALVLTLGLLLLLPSLLKPSLNRLLPELLGTEKQPATVHIESLSWTGIKLSELKMTLSDGDRVELVNLQVRYRLADLLQARVGDVEIDQLSIAWVESNLKEVAVEAAGDARQVAQEHLNDYLEIPALEQLLKLPLDTLRIHQLDITQPEFSSTVQVRVDDALLRINGEVTLTAVAKPWLLELQLQPTGRWFMMLSDQSQLLAQQDGFIRQDATTTYIELNQHLDLAALSKRIAALADIPLPLQDLRLKADIRLPNKGILPAEASVAVNAWLTTNKGKVLAQYPWQASTWALDISKENAQADWRFTLASGAQKMGIQHPDLVQAIEYRGFQQVQANCLADLSQCQASAHINAQLFNPKQVKAQQLLGQLELQPTVAWDATNGVQLQLPVRADAKISQLIKDMPLQKMQLAGDFSASLLGSLWQLQSTDGLTLTLAAQTIEGWQQEAVTLKILPGLQLQGDSDSENPRQQFAAQPLNIDIQPFKLTQAATKHQSASEIKVAASQFSCRPYIAQQGFSSSCLVKLNTLKSSFEGWPIPEMSITGSMLLNQMAGNSQIDGQLQLHAANDLIRSRINIQHNLESQRGNLQWHLEDLKLNWYTLDLVEMLALTKLDLLHGSLAGQGWVDWQQQNGNWLVSPDISLRIDGLSAVYDNTVAMEGWNGLFALRRPFMGNYLLDAQLSGKSLNPGIELKNILARSQTEIAADFSWALANIYEVRTDLLGGSISTPLVRYDTRNNMNSFSIEVNRIQLSQVAALEPSSDIKATGILDGLLPIVLTPDGPQVPAGSLFARDPGGNVRYQSQTAEALGQSDQSMGMAMRLLSNFNYHKLQAGVTYQPSGLFNLDLQFQGKNPDFFGGQATHLNVNLEYNLLDLLESLRVADDMISRIEKKYQ